MIRFRFKHKGIMFDAYLPKEKRPERTALWLYGFPATIGENRMTEFITSCGFFMIQPHYPGTYDSEGVFTPHTAVAMVNTSVEALATGKVHNLKDETLHAVPPTITLCIGYSFGCMIALRGITFLRDLCSLLLISPAVSYGNAPVQSGFRESGPTFLDYVERSRPFTYRLGDKRAWLDLYEGLLNEPLGSPPDVKSVLGVVGAKDSAFEIDILRQNFALVVSRYTGTQADINLVIVPDGTHNLNSLLTDETIDSIKAKVLSYCW